MIRLFVQVALLPVRWVAFGLRGAASALRLLLLPLRLRRRARFLRRLA